MEIIFLKICEGVAIVLAALWIWGSFRKGAPPPVFGPKWPTKKEQP